ncbi:hypothetical protein JTE90_026120 [Oedothorax gibbosus]|uniref:UBX domain-containing protein n=1 Tax=Oedothorax gibbosus TaxID=931172 RepID=A0AAV6UZY7_9ARAC|nr:hypothetical protein JTE90_026120 [Oedothorax gibbosus]
MHSARSLKSRLRHRLSSSKRRDDDEEESSQSSLSSRPSTQESKRSSCSRLSADSGAGSLDDFNNRRNSSPDYWQDSSGRRHTAPIRKLLSDDAEDLSARPNTVHAWDGCSTRCSLSKYAPLPAIGAQQDNLRSRTFERPGPVRRQCFMGPLDIDSAEDESLDDVNDNKSVSAATNPPPVFSLSLESDTDSDFDEDSECGKPCVSETDETDDRPKRPLIRSATFTIEKERPVVRGPFLTVAVRLPDGKRVAEKFDCKDVLQTVCDYALERVDGYKPPKYSLVTTDVPKRTFKDLTMSLKDAGIEDKTLLYLQLSNDSDSE